MLRAALIAALAICAWGAPARGADPKAEVRAIRVAEAPVIDGVVDDAVWQRAGVATDFTQVVPVEGARPSERTEFYFLYDDRNLYVGFRCFDDDPEGVIARTRLRDEDQDSDDRVAVMIDPYLDNRNGFMFVLNPNGARRDMLVENSRQVRVDWDGIWYARAQIDAEGWSGEMRIPFQTLNYNPDAESWGLNIFRNVRRRNEQIRWTNAVVSRSFLDLANAGLLNGLDDINQGLGLDVVPSLSIAQNHREPSRDYTNVSPSLDVFYKFTPTLTGVVTANTNFDETELDNFRLNLTRFDLFFPENRAFFLQDASLYEDFGGLRENGRPFFSRRIGFTEDDRGPIRELVPIRGGAKLVGRMGRVNMGLMNVQTGGRGDLDGKNLSVSRVSYNVGRESLAGVVATRGDPETNGDNYLWGLDYRYRNSRLFETRVLNGDFWFQRSSSSGLSGNKGSSSAFGFRIEYPNDRWNWRVGAQEIEKNFYPGLGFLNREGIRRYDGLLRFRRRPKDGWIRTIDNEVEGFVVTGTGNDLESADLRTRWIRIESQQGDRLWIGTRHVVEDLDEPFEIVPGNFIPVDRYDWHRAGMQLETATSRALSFRGSLGHGEFYDGHLTQVRGTITWRPTPLFIGEVFYQQASADLPDDLDFTQRLVRVRAVLAFNPDLSWETIGQYDAIDDDLGFQSRLRWIIEPGREFFLVWNQEFTASSDTINSHSAQGVIKLKWTMRF